MRRDKYCGYGDLRDRRGEFALKTQFEVDILNVLYNVRPFFFTLEEIYVSMWAFYEHKTLDINFVALKTIVRYIYKAGLLNRDHLNRYKINKAGRIYWKELCIKKY